MKSFSFSARKEFIAMLLGFTVLFVLGNLVLGNERGIDWQNAEEVQTVLLAVVMGVGFIGYSLWVWRRVYFDEEGVRLWNIFGERSWRWSDLSHVSYRGWAEVTAAEKANSHPYVCMVFAPKNGDTPLLLSRRAYDKEGHHEEILSFVREQGVEVRRGEWNESYDWKAPCCYLSPKRRDEEFSIRARSV